MGILKIHNGILNIIAINTVDNKECCRQMLHEWLTTNDKCSWRELLEVIIGQLQWIFLPRANDNHTSKQSYD